MEEPSVKNQYYRKIHVLLSQIYHCVIIKKCRNLRSYSLQTAMTQKLEKLSGLVSIKQI